MARLQREITSLREEGERTAARLTAERERCAAAEAERSCLVTSAAADQSRCSDLELELTTANEARGLLRTFRSLMRSAFRSGRSSQRDVVVMRAVEHSNVRLCHLPWRLSSTSWPVGSAGTAGAGAAAPAAAHRSAAPASTLAHTCSASAELSPGATTPSQDSLTAHNG